VKGKRSTNVETRRAEKITMSKRLKMTFAEALPYKLDTRRGAVGGGKDAGGNRKRKEWEEKKEIISRASPSSDSVWKALYSRPDSGGENKKKRREGSR